MSDLQRRSGTGMSRSQRERRAYQLVVAGGALGAFGVVGLVVAMFTGFGAGLPLLALVLAAVCGVLFKRTVS